MIVNSSVLPKDLLGDEEIARQIIGRFILGKVNANRAINLLGIKDEGDKIIAERLFRLIKSDQEVKEKEIWKALGGTSKGSIDKIIAEHDECIERITGAIIALTNNK